MTRTTKEEAMQAFRTLGGLLQEVYGVEKEQLLTEIEILIPTGIFKSELPPLSALASYLSGEGKTEKEIAKLLKRNKTFVKKSIQKASFNTSGTKLPVNIFSGDLSILEAAAHYLRNSGKNNSDISSELNRSQSGIWMLLKRAREKLGGGKE